MGPEIIAGWLAQSGPDERASVCVLGPQSWLDTLPRGVTIEPVGPSDYAGQAGRPDEDGARVAWAAMEAAATGCANGRFAGVVTGPVSKAQLARVGYAFPGQTEFFADRWGGDPVMAFRGDHLRVALATWHVPLREVPSVLSPAKIQRAVAAAAKLAQADGVLEPRIAVCGLNPHAGEAGLLGRDEMELIDPALNELRVEYPGLSRALPGDTVWSRALRGEFDAIVAMYHDQGLAPLKAVDFDNAVNVTLGLPHVRTSPDHGTAFDIAGQGIANFVSFSRAVALARRLT